MFRKLSIVAIVLFILIRIFLAAQVPENEVYTIDERIAVHSGLLMMVNTTPICLEWPGGPLLMIISALAYLKLILTTSFVKLLAIADILGVSKAVTFFIANTLNASQFYLLVRVLLQSTGLLLFLIMMSSKQLKSMPGRTFFILLVLSSPVLLNAGMIIHPDSLAVFIWAPLLCFVICFNSFTWGNVIRTGFLIGLLLSVKLTYLVGVPFLLLYIFYVVYKQQTILIAARSIFWIGIIACAVFIAFCPFIITDTLTVLKAFAGQLIAKTNEGANSWNKLLQDFLPNLIAFPFLILAAVGLIFGLIKKFSVRTLLLLSLLLVFVLPFAKSAATHTRYCFPFIPVLIFLAYDGWLVIQKYVDEKSKIFQISYLSILLIVSIFVWVNYRAVWSKAFFTTTNFNQIESYIANNVESNETLILPEDLMYFFEENKESLNRLIAMNANRTGVMNKLKINHNNDTSTSGAPVGYYVANAIFADHSNYMNAYLSIKLDQITEISNLDKVYDIYYYSDAGYAAVTSIDTKTISMITSKGYVVSNNSNLQIGKLVMTFDDNPGKAYYLYRL